MLLLVLSGCGGGFSRRRNAKGKGEMNATTTSFWASGTTRERSSSEESSASSVFSKDSKHLHKPFKWQDESGGASDLERETTPKSTDSDISDLTEDSSDSLDDGFVSEHKT